MRNEDLKGITRRYLFEQAGRATGFGLGAIALSHILGQDLYGEDGALPALHFAPKAKNIIYLQQAGGAPHIDIFEYKPLLEKRDQEPIPESLIKGERFAFIRGIPKIQKSPFSFKQYGQSGVWLSNLVPHLAEVVDDVAFIHSMHTTQFNHGPAQIFLMTGHQIPGRPAFGSWLSYGIGSDCKDLPAYVVLLSGVSNPDGGSACWGSGFLPTMHQGVPFQKKGDPINFVSNPEGMKAETRRSSLDLIADLNRENLSRVGDPEISTHLAQYELAYKMQSSVPGLIDIASEPPHVHEMYGTTPGVPSYANNALLARRLVERGVRFVQLCHRNWDMHGGNYNDDVINKT